MPVNFTPRNGARIQWVVPGPGTGFPPDTDTFLNTAAGDPFGTGPGGTLNLPVFRARYGTPPVNAANTEGVFKVYAESIGSLSTAMHNAALDPNNPWGLRPTGNGHATQLEVHDFAATECPQGRQSAIFAKYFGDGGGTSVTPGQPAITVLLSPRPGDIEVSWQTRPGHSAFEVRVGNRTFTTSRGTDREMLIMLPPGEGGLFDVTVTAFIGNTPGKPSLPKVVNVTAAQPSDNPPPPPPPPPVDEPPPSVPVPQPTLSTEAQRTVRDMVGWSSKPLGPVRANRLVALATELRALGLLS